MNVPPGRLTATGERSALSSGCRGHMDRCESHRGESGSGAAVSRMRGLYVILGVVGALFSLAIAVALWNDFEMWKVTPW